jgi:hypothetical protein
MYGDNRRRMAMKSVLGIKGDQEKVNLMLVKKGEGGETLI